MGNLNGKFTLFDETVRDRAKVFPVAAGEGRRVFEGVEDGWKSEVGADLEFDAGPGRLKLISLARHKHNPAEDTFLRGGLDGSNLYQSDFRQTTDEGEYILRSEYSLKTAPGREWQVSGESAFNFLEADTSLAEGFGGGALMPVVLDTSDVRVEERRFEAMLTHTRALSPRLTLQAAIGAEQSELSQSGDTAAMREFVRPKGYGSLSWAADDSLTLLTRLERRVGQLDFSILSPRLIWTWTRAMPAIRRLFPNRPGRSASRRRRALRAGARQRRRSRTSRSRILSTACRSVPVTGRAILPLPRP